MEISPNDKNNFCRICFQEDHKMVPIYVKANGASPYEKLVHHTKLRISRDDGGSESICLPCLEELDFVVNFLNKCFNANELSTSYKKNVVVQPNNQAKDDTKSDSADSVKLIINEDYVPSDNEETVKVNNNGKRRYKCESCHKSFTRRGNLRLHLNRHNGEREHRCIKCGAAVLTRTLARQHCAPRVSRPCPIPGCELTFLSAQGLKIHISKHSGERPYECADCHKKFRCKNTLRGHMKIHTGIKPYVCPICGRRFTTNKLTTHMRTHAATVHACDTCQRAFPTARALSQHAATHEQQNARDFACTLCPAAYNHKQSLNKHIKKMHNETIITID